VNDRIIKDIRKASRVGYTSAGDVVSLLLKSGWCEVGDLCVAYELLKEGEELNATAFFQLPYRLDISSGKRVSLQWEHGAPVLAFSARTVGHAHDKSSTSDRLSNQLSDIDRMADYTQVRITFSLWGRRRQYYRAYLTEIANTNGHSRKHIVKAERSWHVGRPLTAETYESDLCSRLYHESVRIMMRVVEAYSTLARDPIVEPLPALPNFFVMAKNGRLILRPKHENDEQEARPRSCASGTVRGSDLAEATVNRSKFSQYERFLVDAIRHIDSGNPNLAIVQAVMILDWFANTILAERLIKPIEQQLSRDPSVAEFVVGRIWESKGKRSQIRVRTIDKFKEYFSLIGMIVPPKLIAQLATVIALRNDIVHKRQVESVSEDLARNAIDTAIDIVRHLMLQMKIAVDMGQFE